MSETKKKTQKKSGKKQKFYFREATIQILRMALKIAFFILILAVFYLGIRTAYQFGYGIFTDDALSANATVSANVTVVDGESALTVGKELERDGIIDNGYVFWMQTLVYEAETLKPGTYTVDNSMSSKEIMNLMRDDYD